MTVTSEREGEGLDCPGWDCDWDWAVEVGSKTSPGSGSEPSNNRPGRTVWTVKVKAT